MATGFSTLFSEVNLPAATVVALPPNRVLAIPASASLGYQSSLDIPVPEGTASVQVDTFVGVTLPSSLASFFLRLSRSIDRGLNSRGVALATWRASPTVHAAFALAVGETFPTTTYRVELYCTPEFAVGVSLTFWDVNGKQVTS